MVNNEGFRLLSNAELQGFKNIQGFARWEEVFEIEKGWSDDKKYYIKDKLGKEMLLRVSNISNYESKKMEFQVLKNIEKQGINMSRPLHFGVCSNETKVYSLLTYIKGIDAESILPTLTEKQQYDLGFEAGQILGKIHSIKAPEGQEPWGDRFNKKIERKIKIYNQCEIKIPNGERIIEYLNQNRDLLEDKNQSIHHGDYHVGNLIVTDDMKIGVIDFNRYDYGEPWEEFNRIAFSLRVSKPFVNGQIHGYFNGEPPMEFFKLLALYLGSNSLSSVAWAVSFGEYEVKFMLGMANEMMEYYRDFEIVVPTWYKQYFNINTGLIVEEKNMNKIDLFWERFLKANNYDSSKKYLEAFHFELTEFFANELLRLVLEGEKRATASSLKAYEITGDRVPQVGDYSIVTDWDGNPRCVIETKEITIIPFKDITFDICKREGEDECLETWREGHIKFFKAEGKEIGYEFSGDLLVVFEDFDVVYRE